jgi:hypothetical protein
MNYDMWPFRVCVLLLLVLFPQGCRKSELSGTVNTHKDDSNRFTIVYPRSWKTQAGSGRVAVFITSPPTEPDDSFAESIYVGVSKMPPTVFVDKFFLMGAIQARREKSKDFELIDSSLVELNGVNASRISYRHRVDQKVIRSMTYSLIKNERLYLIECTALENSFDEYEAAFEKACNSFQAY